MTIVNLLNTTPTVFNVVKIISLTTWSKNNGHMEYSTNIMLTLYVVAASHLMLSFCCPPNATTVRMELRTSSATAPALAYAANSLLDVLVSSCIAKPGNTKCTS